MTNIDWLILAGYSVFILLLGIYFSRRAGKSIDDYFLGGRNLPWWVIGTSSVATYSDAGLAPAVTMLVFTGGLLGNGVWWICYAIWMPLVAIIWSKFWRKLKILTTAELIEVRYSGKAAGVFRGIYALFMCFGFAVILMGYVTGWLQSALSPILGWSGLKLLLIFGSITLVYTVMSGLLGAAYSDVPQFIIFLIGNIIFVPLIINTVGGFDIIYDNIHKLRGDGGYTDFFKAFPPTKELTGLTILAFTVQGMFFAASPSGGEGFTAQRFMAAKNEFHAQVGQLLNAILTLVIRVVPFLFIGIAAASVIAPGSVKEPGDIWAMMVSKYSVSGLTGILIAGIIASYMSTIDTEINWGASYMINDIYKRFIYHEGTNHHYVIISRIFSVMMMGFAICIAYFLVEEMKTWFLFINSVMVAFLLPLSWLRFFWWRLNIYGEASAIISSIPLGYFIWFVLGFKDKPFWQGFLLLFLTGFITIIIVSLLTKPEKMSTLRNFYLKCRPPGLWKPVKLTLNKKDVYSSEELKGDIIDSVFGIVFCTGSIVTIISFFSPFTNWIVRISLMTITLISVVVFINRWKSKNIFKYLKRKI